MNMTQEYEQYILNEKNKYITKKFIEQTLKQYNIDHKVKNLNNFKIAFIHVSYLKEQQLTDKFIKLLKEIEPIRNKSEAIPLQENSYEVLEFLGDAVIHAVIAEYLFRRYPDKDQGFLTKLRTKIEKGETLNRFSRKLKFDDYAIISRNIEISGGRENNMNIMEDIFEAFIGALKLETDFETCQQFIINFIDSEIDFADLINNEDNYKELLMQYYHKNGYKTTPTYSMINTIDEKPRKLFEMIAKNPEGKQIGHGISTSKVQAAQNAAKMALEKLGYIKNNSSEEESEEEYYVIDE
jgi:dsRNA-specific ribonuclease